MLLFKQLTVCTSPKPLMFWAVKQGESPEGAMDSKKGCSHHHYLPGCPRISGIMAGEGKQDRNHSGSFLDAWEVLPVGYDSSCFEQRVLWDMVPHFSLHSPRVWVTWLPSVCSTRWWPQVKSISRNVSTPLSSPHSCLARRARLGILSLDFWALEVSSLRRIQPSFWAPSWQVDFWPRLTHLLQWGAHSLLWWPLWRWKPFLQHPYPQEDFENEACPQRPL